MKARGGGVIVNVVGNAALTHDPEYICGVAGNAALTAFSLSLGSVSHRDGIRVVVDLKRGENANVILNKLYKFTKLQTTFGVISLAIVHGRPQVLPLKKMLRHFVDFRRDVVVRRTTFDLNKAEQRAHILEGLKRAIDNREHPTQLRQHGRILGPRRPSERIASRCEQFDALLDPRQKIADAGRHIHALLPSGEPAHEPFVQFLDPDLGGSVQPFAGIDRADLRQLQGA